jgi:hypothetical protein
MSNNTTKSEPVAISVAQATQLAPLGVTSVYKLIAEGKLKSCVVNNRRWIDFQSFKELLKRNATRAQALVALLFLGPSLVACGRPRKSRAANRFDPDWVHHLMPTTRERK